MKSKIAVIANSKYYKEYRDACTQKLKELGWTTNSHDSIATARSGDILIFVGMAFFSEVPFFKGKTVIGIQGEQLPLPQDSDWSLKRNLKRYKAMSYFYDLVIEWSPQNYEHHKCSVPRKFIPFGAPEASKHPKSNEWDVVFIGNPYGGKGRRIPILKALAKACKLNPVREAWGAEKFKILNSTKICLNLHQFETHSFESPRIYELLSEGCFVLSEPIQNSFPFIEGQHYVAFEDVDQLIEKVHYYCVNAEERQRIAIAGHQKAKEYSQSIMMELLSNEIAHASRYKSLEIVRFTRWQRGWLGNNLIELRDAIAAFKNKLIKSNKS